MDENSIISSILAGDRNAFTSLMDRYQHMVHAVAFRVLRNDLDAEEVTQDVFVKTYQHLGGFKGRGKFSTWLYSVAYRTAVTARMQRKRAMRSVDHLHGTIMAEAADATAEEGDPIIALQHVLDRLPQEDAAMIRMFHLENFSVREIGLVTGMSAANVKVKLHRTRKKLYAMLRPRKKGLTGCDAPVPHAMRPMKEHWISPDRIASQRPGNASCTEHSIPDRGTRSACRTLNDQRSFFASANTVS